MGDRIRDKFVAEIEKLRVAIKKTNSVKLRTDYTKKVREMERELKEYDMYHKKGAK